MRNNILKNIFYLTGVCWATKTKHYVTKQKILDLLTLAFSYNSNHLLDVYSCL